MAENSHRPRQDPRTPAGFWAKLWAESWAKSWQNTPTLTCGRRLLGKNLPKVLGKICPNLCPKIWAKIISAQKSGQNLVRLDSPHNGICPLTFHDLNLWVNSRQNLGRIWAKNSHMAGSTGSSNRGLPKNLGKLLGKNTAVDFWAKNLGKTTLGTATNFWAKSGQNLPKGFWRLGKIWADFGGGRLQVAAQIKPYL